MDGLQERARRGLVLLGCGKMGSALLAGWRAGGLAPSAIWVIEPSPSAELRALTGEGLHLNEELPATPAVCVLAVKPQMMAHALPQVSALGGGSTLILSIAAGTAIDRFEAVFGAGTPIVRAMPNTPAAIGRGITALIGNGAADAGALALAETVLRAVGETVRLEDEAQMDAVTALSGSGPAYVFHLIECMAAAGAAEGLAPDLAMRLAIATVGGAGALAAAGSEPPASLRVNVTSPGGTTAAGLTVLMDSEHGLPPLIQSTVAAAAERSRALRD
ncbi:MAG: pyrroline-5-carboxylate reductase [Pseudomonadota bacterium]